MNSLLLIKKYGEQKQLRQNFENIQRNVTWGHFANLLDSLSFGPKNISSFFPIEKFFTSHRKVRGAKTIENKYFETKF